MQICNPLVQPLLGEFVWGCFFFFFREKVKSTPGFGLRLEFYNYIFLLYIQFNHLYTFFLKPTMPLSNGPKKVIRKTTWIFHSMFQNYLQSYFKTFLANQTTVCNLLMYLIWVSIGIPLFSKIPNCIETSYTMWIKFCSSFSLIQNKVFKIRVKRMGLREAFNKKN